MFVQSTRQTAADGQQNPSTSDSPKAFTLVELLVVITIIGMLAALLLPAVNSARESARQAVCMNNQRNFATAVQNYVQAKGWYPGYRQLLSVVVNQTTGTTQPAVISWQVALMPYGLGRNDVYEAIKNGAIGQPPSAGKSPQPLPYWELSVCPSDNSISGRSNPWTSYVANTGLLDFAVMGTSYSSTYPYPYAVEIGTPSWSTTPVPLESSANGVFQDQVLGTSTPSSTSPQNYPLLESAKVRDEESHYFRDGHSATLMIAENIDAHYYSAYDDWSTSPTYSIPLLTATQSQWQSYLATNNTSWGDCWERGAGFVWWDTSTANTNSPPSPPSSTAPPYPVAGINGARGDYDPGTLGWPTSPSDTTAPVTSPTIPSVNSNYATRPASNHPGGVNVVFADGHTQFMREDIDYPVFCLLMTPNGANATTNSYVITGTSTTVTFPPAQSWQKFSPLTDGSF
jgi:prepilin-type N-terminal cleavage/methylation domain-containing protein/prepilin-type processing-associated H-X9-DG protein